MLAHVHAHTHAHSIVLGKLARALGPCFPPAMTTNFTIIRTNPQLHRATGSVVSPYGLRINTRALSSAAIHAIRDCCPLSRVSGCLDYPITGVSFDFVPVTPPADADVRRPAVRDGWTVERFISVYLRNSYIPIVT